MMQQLFVASYAGTITTLELVQDSRIYQLRERATTSACSPTPSWITLDAQRRILYATEGGKSGKGTLMAYQIQPDGCLIESSSVAVPIGAAYHILYDNNNAIGIPFFYDGVVGTYDVKDAAKLKALQEMTFDLSEHGIGRLQDKPRPHQTMIDPTGHYAFVPDLGSDMIRVFKISHEPETLHHWTPIEPLRLPQESWPRHAASVNVENGVRLYVLTQDTNLVINYKVEYRQDGSLDFHKEEEFELRPTVPHDYPRSAHLILSPDNEYLIASVRGDASYSITSPIDPKTTVKADTIISYRINQKTGALTLADVSCAGGSFPRQFALNHTGDKIAIVGQKNGWISVFDRDISTGKIGSLLAVKDGFGEMGSDQGPVCIVWDIPDDS